MALENKRVSLSDLEEELLLMILRRLPPRSLVLMERTSKMFSRGCEFEAGEMLSLTDYAARQAVQELMLGWDIHMVAFGRSWKWVHALATHPTKAELLAATEWLRQRVDAIPPNAESLEDKVTRAKLLLAIGNLEIKIVFTDQIQTAASGEASLRGSTAVEEAVALFGSAGPNYLEEFLAANLRAATLWAYFYDHLDGPLRTRRNLPSGELVEKKIVDLLDRVQTLLEKMKTGELQRRRPIYFQRLLEINLMIVQGQFAYAHDDFPRAIELYSSACTAIKKLTGGQSLLVAEACQKVGRAYEMGARDFHGKMRENMKENARTAYEQSLQIRKVLLGEDHPDTKMVAQDLADVTPKPSPLALPICPPLLLLALSTSKPLFSLINERKK